MQHYIIDYCYRPVFFTSRFKNEKLPNFVRKQLKFKTKCKRLHVLISPSGVLIMKKNERERKHERNQLKCFCL